MTRAGIVHARQLARDIGAPARLEIFLVSAVTAFLAIRVFLELTDYPQVGHDRLHVAHMLWGGLLMLAALFVHLSFLGGAAQTLGAVLGGLGFGTFIDEIGKFLTRDNDYFFRPAVALVYVSFILVFLAGHVVHARRRYAPHEYLLNALREMEQLVLHDLDREEQARVLDYLSRSDPANPLVPALERAVRSVEPVPLRAASWPARARAAVRTRYRWMASRPWFDVAVIAFFVGQLLLKLAYAAAIVVVTRVGLDQPPSIRLLRLVAARLQDLSLDEVAQLVFSGLSAVFVALGVLRIAASRLVAYGWFERAILVSILLVQPFTFVDRQLAGLAALAGNLILLATLRTVSGLERERSA